MHRPATDALLAGWVVLAGCNPPIFTTGGDTADSADTAVTVSTEPNGSSGTIVAATWGCDAENTAWTWDIRIDRWTSDGTLDLIRTTTGDREEHDLVLVATDAGGAWDERRAGPLTDGQAPESQTANVDTRFDCETDATRLSFAIRVRGADGSLMDCVVGGSDPAGATAVVRDLDPDVLTLGGCHEPPGN